MTTRVLATPGCHERSRVENTPLIDVSMPMPSSNPRANGDPPLDPPSSDVADVGGDKQKEKGSAYGGEPQVNYWPGNELFGQASQGQSARRQREDAGRPERPVDVGRQEGDQKQQ